MKHHGNILSNLNNIVIIFLSVGIYYFGT